MTYNHILIRYGELGLKGRNIKMFLTKLQQNIQHAIRDFEKAKVKRTQGRLFIILNGENPDEIIKIVKDIFGIYSLSLAVRVENDEDEIFTKSLKSVQENKEAKTFKVVTRRADKSFPLTSQEMNRKLGGYILKQTEHLSVDVHNPDIKLQVEIRQEGTFITSKVIYGPGGLPVGTAGKSLLLLSGGIDSPVAGYLMMKRGIELEMIHFHSPPFTSERAKQKVVDLTEKLTKYGHRIKIHMVPFTELQQLIFKHYPERYGMTIMRRVMLKIAEQIANKNKILSLTTGESLGQVASQTMASMNAINEVTNLPVLRPLVAMDKEEIIHISEQIDTYDISIQPYEDCCTVFVPKSPITNPKREKVIEIEASFDLTESIEKAVTETEIQVVTEKNKLYEQLL